MSIQLGQKAPDFKLYNSDGKEVSLSGQKGKNVLLLFFPLAFTGTCTTELCRARDNFSVYNDLNAVVFAISVDSTYALAKFKEEQNLNFDLLSDFNKSASKAYDSLYPIFGSMSMEGISKRSAFVIDKDGILRHAEILEKASDLPDFDAIVACLKTLSA